MTAVGRFTDHDFIVSGHRVSVRLPASWDLNNDRVWVLRGPQIRAKLREACCEQFGMGVLWETDGGYHWQKGRPSSLPELLLLSA